MTDTAPDLDPVAETPTPADPPVADPVAELEPVAEPVADPVAELVVDPVAPAADPVAELEPVAEPVADPVADPVAELVVDPVAPAADPVAEPVAEPAPVTEAPSADTVPTGTIAAVLAWVEEGDDSDARALAALELEQNAKAPRSTLIAALEAVIEAAAEAVENAATEDTAPPEDTPPADLVATGYRAETTFTAMVGVQIVTFRAGDEIDPVLAAELAASGAPITVLED